MKKLLFFTIILILFSAKIGKTQTESTYNNISIKYGVDTSTGIGLSYVYLFTDSEISKVWGFLKTTKGSTRYDVWDSKYVEKKLSCSYITLSYAEEWKPDWNKTGIKTWKYFASDYMITLFYNGEEYFIRFYPDKSLVFQLRQQKTNGNYYTHTLGVEAYKSEISNIGHKKLKEMIPVDLLEKLKDVILASITDK